MITFADHPQIPDPEVFGYDAAGGYYTPSPAEIRAKCEQIQATWPPRERALRMQWSIDRERVEPMQPTTPGNRC